MSFICSRPRNLQISSSTASRRGRPSQGLPSTPSLHASRRNYITLVGMLDALYSVLSAARVGMGLLLCRSGFSVGGPQINVYKLT